MEAEKSLRAGHRGHILPAFELHSWPLAVPRLKAHNTPHEDASVRKAAPAKQEGGGSSGIAEE